MTGVALFNRTVMTGAMPESIGRALLEHAKAQTYRQDAVSPSAATLPA